MTSKYKQQEIDNNVVQFSLSRGTIRSAIKTVVEKTKDKMSYLQTCRCISLADR